MSYLEDKEKRLLFAALSREKKVCEEVDKECCIEPYETSLKSIVENLENKFYYDRFEKEIYNKAIGDFVKLINEISGWTPNCIEHNLSLTVFTLHQIAEELKG